MLRYFAQKIADYVIKLVKTSFDYPWYGATVYRKSSMEQKRFTLSLGFRVL